jgi:hypothetical protein
MDHWTFVAFAPGRMKDNSQRIIWVLSSQMHDELMLEWRADPENLGCRSSASAIICRRLASLVSPENYTKAGGWGSERTDFWACCHVRKPGFTLHEASTWAQGISAVAVLLVSKGPPQLTSTRSYPRPSLSLSTPQTSKH